MTSKCVLMMGCLNTKLGFIKIIFMVKILRRFGPIGLEQAGPLGSPKRSRAEQSRAEHVLGNQASHGCNILSKNMSS